MKPRRLCYGWIVLPLAIVVTAMLGFRELKELRRYQSFIELEYKKPLSFLEHQLQTGGDVGSDFDSENDKHRTICARITEAFPDEDIFSIVWDRDEDWKQIKDPPCDYVHFNILRSKDAAGTHVVTSGRAFDGAALLMFDGSLSPSRNRHYLIVFRKKALDAKMK